MAASPDLQLNAYNPQYWGCARKVGYPTRRLAKRAARAARGLGLGKKKPYPCHFCNDFHLTSVRNSWRHNGYRVGDGGPRV